MIMTKVKIRLHNKNTKHSKSQSKPEEGQKQILKEH